MRYIADLHIHSPFSRATSKTSNLQGLAAWAGVKGINLLGTGDFTHPGWFAQLREQLVEAEPGFFKLKDPEIPGVLVGVPSRATACRFLLTAEISSIYKRHGRVRKVHNILVVPSFDAAAAITARLAAIGNIESDGRPILGLDSRNLLEILLEQAPEGFLVPAHIWTPWFSLFGSKSGFEAIEECYGDLTEHVFALETGLSSDPEMNRRISALDRFTLISNSDCHSPGKLGREANLFETDFDFFAMREALKDPAQGFLGTIEFFPEEGKYHFDGHRKCGVCLDPVESRGLDGICPVCGRPLTIGVMHRVMELADRRHPAYPAHGSEIHSIIPLPEVLSELVGVGPASKAVLAQYTRVIGLFGSEFDIFLKTPVAEISERYSSVLGEAIKRIRQGRVIRNSGYDGEFGVIKVFEEDELDELRGQSGLFGAKKTRRKKKSSVSPPLFEKKRIERPHKKVATPHLNPEQTAAVASPAVRVLVKAGPGTGKTHTLIARLAGELGEIDCEPEKITAITFTNRAAEEVRERLSRQVGSLADKVFVGTFHAFCLHWLRQGNSFFLVVGRAARDLVLRRLFGDEAREELARVQEEIAAYFHKETVGGLDEVPEAVQVYLQTLAARNSIDLDEIIPFFVRRLGRDQAFRKKVLSGVHSLFVDEFQDLNRAQYELVTVLADRARVFAIGDPDQAIYGFRGSSPAFFHRFIEEFEPETVSLTRNYRSAPAILEAAGAVIRCNPRDVVSGPAVDLQPESDQRVKIERYHAPSPRAEAEFVVSRIESLMGGISHFSLNSGRGRSGQSDPQGCGFGEIAVLYRLSRQAEELAVALGRRGIPFQVVDLKPFYMKAALNPFYYWVLAAAGLAELPDYLALLKNLKGLGAQSLARLSREIKIDEHDVLGVASRVAGLPVKVSQGITELARRLESFKNMAAATGLTPALREVRDFLGLAPEPSEMKRLFELAGAFGRKLAPFAEHLKKNSSGTMYDEQAEAVTLMTMHAAKGLEFPAVFIAGLEDNLVPCAFQGGADREGRMSEAEIAEERRLFYVALTRARCHLVLTSAANRLLFGRVGKGKSSRFLGEIPARLLVESSWSGSKKKRPQGVQMSLF